MVKATAIFSKTAEPIAIIGMACRYPGAANVVELWENILTCRQQFRDIPDVRLPASEYYDPDSAVDDKTYGRRAALLDGFEFDPRVYRIPRQTFVTTDIVHWLALSTALEAFGNAGLHDENFSRDRAGVILGNTLTGEETRSNILRLRWPFVRRVFRRTAELHGLTAESVQAFESTMEYLYKSVFPTVTEDTLAGALSNTIAGRICNYLDFHGGGYIVDGACSSSLLSIATAADYLHQHKLDIVIAGGVDVSLDPFELIGFSKATALSKDDMRVYDRRGHGFIPGEGCGMVVLQRLEDARRDGNRVYAVLRGWGISSDGRGGMTAPSAKGQSLALIRAYRNAGYPPQSLAFIEGHGTGTVVGDRVELEGISAAFTAFGDVEDHSVGITSFKSIVGHTKAAAGIGGFIKAVIAVNRRIIPPTAGCKEPHKSFTDTAKALYPVRDGQIFTSGDHIRAGVSAMGFGGINCHVTLESGDSPAAELEPSINERSLLGSQQESEVFPFSAVDLTALIDAVRSTRHNANGISSAELIDLASHCTELLSHLPWRAAVVAGTVEELIVKLELLEVQLQTEPPSLGQIWRGEQIWISNNADCARFGFLFPGQGSQKIGMSRTLSLRFDWAQRFADIADDEVRRLRAEYDDGDHQPLSSLYLLTDDRDPGKTSRPSAMAMLTRTENAQPAICAASWLWFERLQLLGIRPTVVGGHSLGELTALAAAGVYDSTVLIRLAALRGIAMSASVENSGSMAALSCDAGSVEDLIDRLETGYCVIANRNSPNQTVVSGESAAVRQIVELALQKGIQGSLLPVANAFHSRMVASAAERIRESELIPSAVMAVDECRIFSGIDGQEICQDVDLRNYCASQILSPVDFSRLLESMSPYCDSFIEVGPGGILTSLANSHDPALVKPCQPIERIPGRDADLNAVVAEAFVRGAVLNWSELYAERLVRPFLPASQRKFYVNPCERELAIPNSGEVSSAISLGSSSSFGVLNNLERISSMPVRASVPSTGEQQRTPANAFSVRSVLSARICELTGFSEDSIVDDTRLIDDLNLDSIKIGSLLGEVALQLGVAGKVDNMQLISADFGTVVSAFEAAIASTAGSFPVLELLFDLVEKSTGFNRDILKPDQRLLDDLNIDSIKAVSLLGELLLQTQTQSRVDAVVLSNATLGEIASQVDAAIATRNPVPAAIGDNLLKTKKQARWVRAFSLSKLPEPLPGKGSLNISSGHVLLIAPGGHTAIAEQLAGQLKSSLFHDTPGPGYDGEPSILIVVLDGTNALPYREYVRQLSLFQRLYREHPKLWQHIRTIAIIQRQSVDNPLEAPNAWSFAASIYLERSELEVVALGFDQQLSADFIARQLAAELRYEARYHAAEYDPSGNRSLRRIDLVAPEQCIPRNLEWSSHDVLLVTGGGKGITAECVLAFARETGVRVALIGRSLSPEPGEQSELASTLDKLNKAGIEYRYYTADVADSAALALVVASIKQELGTITGVLHGAGTNTPRRVIDVTAEEAEKEIAPKVQGAVNLLALFDTEPPKLFAAFTSIIGITGMRNNAWYAYSNETVARYLEAFSDTHPETAVLCFAFGVWDEVGMGVKLGSVQYLEQMGIDAIPLQEGVKQFMRWMRLASPNPEIIVTASSTGLPTWQRIPEIKKQMALPGRFLGFVEQEEAGVERISKVTLDSQLDLYLADHNYQGTLLFPTVMGLEAMAQNCLAIAGDPDLEVIRIEAIRLDRPIMVYPGRPLTIEIRVLALERENLLDQRVISASIHGDQSSKEVVYFSADFVIGKRQSCQATENVQLNAGVLGIVPSLDLYGGVLFQGPLFQRMSAIQELDRSHVLFTTEARQETILMPEGFAESVRAPLVLGDPYYRDTLLQAAQLSLIPEICLPIRIEAIDFYATNMQSGFFHAQARVIGRDGRRVFGDVTVVDDKNNLIERITGYEVQVLDRRAGFPTPEQLLEKPYDSEPSLLQRELEQAAAELGYSAPVAVLRRIPSLCSKEKAIRQRLEEPLFHAALHLAALRYAVDTDSYRIHWLDSGKPEVFRSQLPSDKSGLSSIEEIGVSLSHDDDWILCIAAKGLQGCDLAFIMNRTSEQWRAMFTAQLADLLQKLEHDGDSINQAGTRLWSALEAAMKAFDSKEVILEIIHSKNDKILFRAFSNGRMAKILTMKSTIAGGLEGIIAVTISEPLQDISGSSVLTETHSTTQKMALSADRSTLTVVPIIQTWGDWLSNGGDTADFFCVKAEHAEANNQLYIRFRFPLAFKDGANPDGTMYFVRLFEWMGRLREMTLRPVFDRLAKEFVGGHFAWVTNQSWAQIMSPVRTGDVVEVNCRLLGRGGPKNSMVSVGFDWHKVGRNGALHLMAKSQVQVTWAKVIGHGRISPTSYPPYLDRFLDEMTSNNDHLRLDSVEAFNFARKRIGVLDWQAASAPHSGIFLHQQNFSTSINDANLVGNIYYTKYYELQGIVLDSYFFKVIPETYQIPLNQGGLRCIFTEVKHLRDAMPFDTIDVRMYLHAIYEYGIELRFDFFRIDTDGHVEKLATGVHIAAWAHISENDTAENELLTLPDKLLEHLRQV